MRKLFNKLFKKKLLTRCNKCKLKINRTLQGEIKWNKMY